MQHIARNMRDGDREEVFCQMWTDEPDDFARLVINHYGFYKWAVSLGDDPVCALGAVTHWPGVWIAWMVTTDRFPEIGSFVTKFVRRSMIPSLHRLGAHRCEARSIASHTEAHRWLKVLGAKQEAVLRRYGKNREDFLLFRWDRADVLCPETTR